MSDTTNKGPIAWMASHGVAPNILMLLFIAGGVFMYFQMKKEVFPDFAPDRVTVIVPFPGAGPEEVEEGVILAIEEEVRSLTGVDEIQATASEGNALVVIEALTGADVQRLHQDVKQAVDRIDTFPEDIREPRVSLSTWRRSVIDLKLYGDVDEWTLREATELVRNGLLQHPDITQIDLLGDRDMEIQIEIPQTILREYGLTLSEVARIIADSALDRSGGSLETQAGEIRIRVQERREWAKEYRNIPIITPTTGDIVRLGDIATIIEGFEESDRLGTFNGVRSMGINVLRVGDETPIAVANGVMNSLPDIIALLPKGMDIAITDDDAVLYSQRRDLLLKNGGIGLVLVLFILSLFLEFRLAFWVMMGIPTSFLGAMLFLPFFGVSVNMVSMFAVILALGIVVDDAIVAGENIYEHRQRGDGYLKSAVLGARDISVPVTFSILTNIVAFLPLAFIPGTIGKFWGVIPIVVSLAFIISWVEALFILPYHLSHVKDKKRGVIGTRLHSMQGKIAQGMNWFSASVYGPFLKLALRWRYFTLSIIIASFVLVLAIPMSGRMGIITMPEVEGEYAHCTARLPLGSPMSRAEEVCDLLVASADKVLKEHGGDDLGTGVFALIDENEIIVRIHLIEASIRNFTTAEVTEMWRDELDSDIPGLEMLRFASDSGFGGGPKFSIELSHWNVNILNKASEELALMLSEYSNVKDVDDGYAPGKMQLDFKANDEARVLGLDAGDIARQVRSSFYGVEPIRQQRGRNEVTVKVRLPLEERGKESDIENLLLFTPDGGEVPLYQVAEVVRGRAYTDIERRNGKRVVTVTGNIVPVSETSIVLATAKEDLLPQLMTKYPGLSYSFEGRQADMRESRLALLTWSAIAAVIIYILLAIPFRSYIQPIIVMMAIPFAIVGAILGHLIMGYSISIISIMGIIALSGVVINDGLVMVDYANGRVRAGLSISEAIASAGIRRFRPIMLTTLTTFFGLAPMIFETSRQARFLIPMALSLGYGIVFATFITLLLVPCLYLMIEDFIAIVNRIKIFLVGEVADEPTPSSIK